jgi:replicative DNA helicase
LRSRTEPDYRRERVGSTAPYAFDNEAEVLVRKQRNGPPGTVTLAFDRACMRFRDVAPGQEPTPSPFPEGYQP